MPYTFQIGIWPEVVMPMEYIVPSLRVAIVTDMADEDTLNERLLHLLGLEEHHFIARFNQQV